MLTEIQERANHAKTLCQEHLEASKAKLDKIKAERDAEIQESQARFDALQEQLESEKKVLSDLKEKA